MAAMGGAENPRESRFSVQKKKVISPQSFEVHEAEWRRYPSAFAIAIAWFDGGSCFAPPVISRGNWSADGHEA